MSSTMLSNADGRKAFALFVTLNSAFGLWPLLEVNFCLQIRWAIGVFELALQIFAMIYEMMHSCGNADDFLESVFVISVAVLNLSKLIFYHVHRDKLRSILLSAIGDWSSTESGAYRDIMRSSMRIYKKVTFAIVVAVIWCLSMYYLKSLIPDPNAGVDAVAELRNGGSDAGNNGTQMIRLKKRFVYPSACTLNDIPNPYHLLIVLNQMVQGAICGFVMAGTDAFFVAIVVHIYGQFEILKHRFTTFGSMANSPLNKVSRKNFSILIERHQHLLRLTELLEGAYNKIILVQIMMSLSLLTIAGYSFLVSLKTNNLVGTIQSVLVMQCMLLQSFMYTSIGQTLQNQGTDLMRSVYEGSWYELPQHLTKDLAFVMMRSSVPRDLTAGKFSKMTRATFMDVVKTWCSYLSVLRMILNE